MLSATNYIERTMNAHGFLSILAPAMRNIRNGFIGEASDGLPKKYLTDDRTARHLYYREYPHPEMGKIGLCVSPLLLPPSSIEEVILQTQRIIETGTQNFDSFSGQRSPVFELETPIEARTTCRYPIDGYFYRSYDALQWKGLLYQPLGQRTVEWPRMERYKGIGVSSGDMDFNSRGEAVKIAMRERPYAARLLGGAISEFVFGFYLSSLFRFVSAPFAFAQFLEKPFLDSSGKACKTGMTINFIEGYKTRLRIPDLLYAIEKDPQIKNKEELVGKIFSLIGFILRNGHSSGIIFGRPNFENFSFPYNQHVLGLPPEEFMNYIRFHDFGDVQVGEMSPEQRTGRMLTDLMWATKTISKAVYFLDPMFFHKEIAEYHQLELQMRNWESKYGGREEALSVLWAARRNLTVFHSLRMEKCMPSLNLFMGYLALPPDILTVADIPNVPEMEPVYEDLNLLYRLHPTGEILKRLLPYRNDLVKLLELGGLLLQTLFKQDDPISLARETFLWNLIAERLELTIKN